MAEVRKVCDLLARWDVTLLTEYIPTGDNVAADWLSRLAPADRWQVSDACFDALQAAFGVCAVDAQALPETARLPRFWAPFPVSGASGVNCLAQDWKVGRVYAHLSFRLLPALAQLLRNAPHAGATVIAPFYRGAAWFQQLALLAVRCARVPCDEIVRAAVWHADLADVAAARPPPLIAFDIPPSGARSLEAGCLAPAASPGRELLDVCVAGPVALARWEQRDRAYGEKKSPSKPAMLPHT